MKRYFGLYLLLGVLAFSGCKKDPPEEKIPEIESIYGLNKDWGFWGIAGRPEFDPIRFRVEDRNGNSLLGGNNISETFIASDNGSYSKSQYGIPAHNNIAEFYPLFPPDPDPNPNKEYSLELGCRYTQSLDTLLYTNTYWKVNHSVLHVFKAEFRFIRRTNWNDPDRIHITQVWLDGDPFPLVGGRVVIY